MKKQSILYFILLGSLTLFSNANAERSINIGVESFEWTEPSLDLTEEGTRYSIGFSTGNLLSPRKGLLHQLSLTSYQGTIDYEGATQGGDPLTTDTKYSGLKGEVKLAMRTGILDIVGAAGIEKWSRDIKSAITDSGQQGIGYKETYTQPYVKLGVGLLHQAGNGKGRFEVGYKRPFEVKEEVSIFDESLEPKGKNSVYVQYRYQSNRRWGVTVYSEKTHFEESDIVKVQGGAVRQPESKSVALGAQLQYAF